MVNKHNIKDCEDLLKKVDSDMMPKWMYMRTEFVYKELDEIMGEIHNKNEGIGHIDVTNI